MSGRTRNSEVNRNESVVNPTEPVSNEMANVVDLPVDPERLIDDDALVIDSQYNSELTSKEAIAGVDYDPLEKYPIDKLPEIEKQKLRALYETSMDEINLISQDRTTCLKQWAEEEVEFIWNVQATNELKNPPFSQLLDHVLTLSIAVSRETFVNPELMFHKTIITYGRTKSAAEKIFFGQCFEIKLVRLLKSLKRFPEKYDQVTSLKEILIRVEQSSILNDQKCINKLLKELKVNFMHAPNVTELGRRVQSTTHCAGSLLKFFGQVNHNNSFTIWYLLAGDKAPNRNSVTKSLVKLYGDFKNGKSTNFDTFLSEFRSETGILQDLHPQKICSNGKGKEKPSKKEHQTSNKSANTYKTDGNQGRKRTSKYKKNLKKKAKYNPDKSTSSQTPSD